MKKLIIFDLDGTLFDTTLAMQACGNYALQKLGLPLLSPEDYARCSGGGVEGYVKTVLSAAGDKEAANFDAFWQYYLEKNRTLSISSNVPYQGIPALLKALKEKGVKLAVLSNKDHESCIPIVEGTFGKGVFDVVFGNRDGIAPKPSSEGAEMLISQLSLTPLDCLYVGDTEVDMETGKNAGLDTVAVLWGYRDRETLAKFSPEYIIEKPEEILSLI